MKHTPQTVIATLTSKGVMEPVPEYVFAPPRRWRFDYAWVLPGSGSGKEPGKRKLIAWEIEGAVYARGRHTRGSGYEADCRKYNAAALLGWTVIRTSTGMVENGEALAFLEKALQGE
jgi:hypothetical protein